MNRKCEVCGQEVQSDLGGTDEELDNEAWIAFVYENPRRDFIQCDSCNKLVCHTCCTYPKSGYCDPCIEQHNLLPMLKEQGLIRELDESFYDH